MSEFKTFEDMKNDIPEGATHYFDETDCDFFTWLKVDGDVTYSMMSDSKNFNSWEVCTWKNIMSRAKAIPVAPKRTRTEYEKVEYKSAWKAAKDHEEREVELWRNSDIVEAINGVKWKAIQSPSEAAQYHFDLYVKVEKEIDERQEFVKEASKIWNRDDMHCSTDIFREMYDSGKFKFIG